MLSKCMRKQHTATKFCMKKYLRSAPLYFYSFKQGGNVILSSLKIASKERTFNQGMRKGLLGTYREESIAVPPAYKIVAEPSVRLTRTRFVLTSHSSLIIQFFFVILGSTVLYYFS